VISETAKCQPHPGVMAWREGLSVAEGLPFNWPWGSW